MEAEIGPKAGVAKFSQTTLLNDKQGRRPPSLNGGVTMFRTEVLRHAHYGASPVWYRRRISILGRGIGIGWLLVAVIACAAFAAWLFSSSDIVTGTAGAPDADLVGCAKYIESGVTSTITLVDDTCVITLDGAALGSYYIAQHKYENLTTDKTVSMDASGAPESVAVTCSLNSGMTTDCQGALLGIGALQPLYVKYDFVDPSPSEVLDFQVDLTFTP